MSDHDHQHHHGSGNKECRCYERPPVDNSLVQTLDEVAFENGIWGIISRGAPVQKVREFLQKHSSRGGGSSTPEHQQREWARRKDATGYTPLHYAARKGNVETVQLLISLGAPVDERTPGTQMTALHRAAGCGNIDVCEVLLSAGADKTVKDNQGLTAYDWVEKKMFANAMGRGDEDKEAGTVREVLMKMLAV